MGRVKENIVKERLPPSIRSLLLCVAVSQGNLGYTIGVNE